MSAPLEETKHPGIHKRGSRYVVSFRNAAGKQCWRSASSASRFDNPRERDLGAGHERRGDRVGDQFSDVDGGDRKRHVIPPSSNGPRASASGPGALTARGESGGKAGATTALLRSRARSGRVARAAETLLDRLPCRRAVVGRAHACGVCGESEDASERAAASKLHPAGEERGVA
jgi:hypothetical protein